MLPAELHESFIVDREDVFTVWLLQIKLQLLILQTWCTTIINEHAVYNRVGYTTLHWEMWLLSRLEWRKWLILESKLLDNYTMSCTLEHFSLLFYFFMQLLLCLSFSWLPLLQLTTTPQHGQFCISTIQKGVAWGLLMSLLMLVTPQYMPTSLYSNM